MGNFRETTKQRTALRIAALAIAAVALASGVLAICAGSTTGPDVIVADLYDLAHYTTSGAIEGKRAYAVGTKSLNIGDKDLRWVSGTSEHPVIAQNLYRWREDAEGRARFEQVGMSWLKHGFTALAINEYCGSCTFEPGHSSGSWLGQGCSDPYSASLNGNQSRLGPRSEVDAFSGAFPYTGTLPPGSGDSTLRKRLLVADADVDWTQNLGARYFVEGHYIAADDAAAGNALNNAAYREVTVDVNRNLSFVADSVNRCAWDLNPGTPTRTHCTIPAIYAWRAVDPAVQVAPADVPGEGRFHVAARVHDNGDGTWRYEYAVHNLNSHRAARLFRVPLAAGVAATGAGFRDVEYHSGEPYSAADWEIDPLAPAGIEWAAEAYAVNQNANALRWATTYNFWFDAPTPPVQGPVAIGLFRPGLGAELAVAMPVPGPLGTLFADGLEAGSSCLWNASLNGGSCS